MSSPSSPPLEPEYELVDKRTGKITPLRLTDGACTSSQLPFIILDPGLARTAVASSAISYIDGKNGILRYRGYPIEALVGSGVSFTEVAFLLLHGELPSKPQHQQFEGQLSRHAFLHEDLLSQIRSFRYDSHPMGILAASLSALGTYYPELNPALQGGRNIFIRDAALRNKAVYRILAKTPALAAATYRHRQGRRIVEPSPSDGYVGSFLRMCWSRSPDFASQTDESLRVFSRVMEVLWILHMEHSLNASTFTVRTVASTLADPLTCIASGVNALYGPLHGGANEAALRQLQEIGSVENIPRFIEEVKAGKRKLMGAGHRVYKSYDPRCRIVKQLLRDVVRASSSTGSTTTKGLLAVAEKLEEVMLEDKYFVDRNLYPNVDFYTGIIYHTLGFPTDFFPVLFAIPRVAGWLAHWTESVADPETRIFRPSAVYNKNDKLERTKIAPLNMRDQAIKVDLDAISSSKL